jgi:hypothetical protein
MLVALQFPFTDVRSFVQGDTLRLPVPSWKLPDPDRDFIRSVGPIRERRKKSIQEWPEDEFYCRVSRAIRFDPSYQHINDPDLATLALRRYCAFRRFTGGGILRKDEKSEVRSVAARLEFGFGLRSRTGPFAPSPEQCIACVRSLLKLPVTFRGSMRPIPLVEIRDLFDDLYLQSTTAHKPAGQKNTQNWWLRRGLPLALVEFETSGPLSNLPLNAKRVPSLSSPGLELAYCTVEPAKDLQVGVWLVGVQSEDVDQGILRRLRLNLFRLHAERQGISETLRLIQQEKIEIVRNSEASEQLQRYLEAAVRFLSRETRDNLPQLDILKASEAAEDFAQPGQREKLLENLAEIRGNLFRNVKDYIKKQSEVKDLVFISYSHKDMRFKRDLETWLKPYFRSGAVTAWSDAQIVPGAKWFDKIKAALARAKVALLLVTPQFLASDFIHDNELAPLLKEAEAGGVRIMWVPVIASAYKETPLKDYQALVSPDKPLAEMKAERNKTWLQICEQVKKAMVASPEASES